ncbi:lysophospholipid acyltransferase 2-like isoform X1 [Chiloscyllium plagiosum]|uniref:lysophospholipid acyltransferase 2-like isoform X1 n=1 Tax=Chiloscyllium plagiosum TaxID=36176 RepID=UPI001CB7F9A4|nr:lysophospholipid acyltransferase 2-like isoform X1 [Chiloscyllium plagiosum]XP_043573507.1 lysophospholipid acyltransferase 2-like isoform X1 [Chiloscyllium plagiosum]
MGSSGGSELLLPLSERLRLPIEQVNFAMCQLFGLFTAFLFRNYLHPSKTNHIIRHVVATLLGLHFAFFCFGSYTVYFLGEVILLYCVMVTVHMKRIHKYSFLIAMAYLTMCQIIRVYWFDGKERSADFSGPLMVITQKVTKLAFELRDGLTRDESELSTSQKRLAVRRIPSLLEYLSYNLNFMGILAGPLNSYNDYISFIEGRNFEVGMNHPAIGKKSNKCPPNEPSSLGAVGYKILICTVCVFMHLYLLDVFPISYNTDSTFIATASIPVRLLYLYISSLACRPKYYFAWTIADAVNNAAGFGFTGYDSRGKPCWDLFSNLNIVKVEFATSMKMFIDNWNIQTALWLKEVCYDRCPFNPTLSTFLLSAIWHGVYPGYYFTFITGTIMTLAARAVRNNLRPYFLGSSTYKMFYDVMTWATTQVVVSYTVVPFVLPFLSSSFEFYRTWYFGLHIIAMVLILVLPKKPRSTSREPQKFQVTKQSMILHHCNGQQNRRALVDSNQNHPMRID